jgi:hypothetical protein
MFIHLKLSLKSSIDWRLLNRRTYMNPSLKLVHCMDNTNNITALHD